MKLTRLTSFLIKTHSLIGVAAAVVALAGAGLIVLPSVAAAANATVSTRAELDQAITAAPDGASHVIQVNTDFTIDSEITIPASKIITLTGDDPERILTRAAGYAGHLFVNLGTLTLTNLIIDGGGNTGPAANGSLVSNPDATSTLTVATGAVLRNNHTSSAGGAISNSGTLSMTGGTISNNTAQSGGGIYSAGATTPIVISGSVRIIGNVARAGNGGGIHGDGEMTVTGNAEIANNSAAYYGGGICMREGNIVLTGSSAVHSNTASGAGGGVIMQGTSPTSSLLMSGHARVDNNHALRSGGGINSSASATITDWAQVVGNSTERADGGGVAVRLQRSVLQLSGHAKINRNTTEENGGGVALYEGATTLIIEDDVEIADNRAENRGGGVSLSTGMQQASLTMTGGRIHSNMSASGGGIGIFSRTANVHLSGSASVYDNNAASAWFGGGSAGGGIALYVMSESPRSTVTLDGDASVSHNTVGLWMNPDGTLGGNGSGLGGGIYVEDYTDITVAGNAVMRSNWAIANGGAIGVSGESHLVVRDNAQLTGNATFGNGGALWVNPYGATASIEGQASLTNNLATGDGGAIWVAYDRLEQLDVAAGVTFAGNLADTFMPEMAIADGQTYDDHVFATAFTAPFGQGYNNYDIAYAAEGPFRPATPPPTTQPPTTPPATTSPPTHPTPPPGTSDDNTKPTSPGAPGIPSTSGPLGEPGTNPTLPATGADALVPLVFAIVLAALVGILLGLMALRRRLNKKTGRSA
jgi:hypothetical protein